MTFSPNEMTPYIKKIQQKFDEAQTFLLNYYFHKVTTGLLKDIFNSNGIDKNKTNGQHKRCNLKPQIL